ncbi:dynactin p62 family-domain-containing protein [Durotheca rogersii]|uniref:dynactin p62 family-domain-containing protein n=1 Tax=Durotheca rogersii TaxID=419775 RepID=UPI00221ED86C|nr:dynactin p62 family-domain-containing protein [Durotheca rogersii]KAI5860015.1 dynactin p62 family-domain-containing protein [Durotheca rogersii]
MAPSFTPYTYIQCPCHESTSQGRPADESASPASPNDLPDDDERTFDPRAARSNYSLYPLEYLLYCDVCHQIRCPRCVAEELVTIYCPNCLFEVGSSSLKTEGNRCTRSCFQCPICIGPLAVQALESPPPESSSLLTPEAAAGATATAPSGPWILTCSYCNWNSAEIGVKFDKPQGIFSQLSKLRHGEDHAKHPPSEDIIPRKNSTSSDAAAAAPETVKARFAAMKSFYASQTNTGTSSSSLAGIGDYGLSSPGALSRIMNLYSGNGLGGLGGGGGLKPKAKASAMREAEGAGEGFRAADLDEGAAVARLRRGGWRGTVTGEQARWQVEEGARFTDELWPIPYLLRTKRSKRCPVCRHIISKPESKVGNTRWRIRLVANNYIPSISIKPLNPAAAAAAAGATEASGPGGLLQPLQPAQFLLTFKNPIFEDIKVTLATPAATPGRFASKVTVLCPEFHIDANTDTDMYLDDVLKEGDREGARRRHRGDESGGGGGTGAGAGPGGPHQAEAGKVWERGRNWVSIVVEVVPASLRGPGAGAGAGARPGSASSFSYSLPSSPALSRKQWAAGAGTESESEAEPEQPAAAAAAAPEAAPLREDEDVLEIPMFVRLEWEGDVSQDQVGGGGGGGTGASGGKEKDSREKKELAYWCAIGIGRISQEAAA